MEQEIRYCTTEDGASIAYATAWAGPAVIIPPSIHGVEFDDRGEQETKGGGEPVRVYAARGKP